MGEAAVFCTDRSRLTRPGDSPRAGCLQGRTDIFTFGRRSMQDLSASARGRLCGTCSPSRGFDIFCCVSLAYCFDTVSQNGQMLAD